MLKNTVEGSVCMSNEVSLLVCNAVAACASFGWNHFSIFVGDSCARASTSLKKG